MNCAAALAIGVRFSFDCYKHWAHIIFRHPDNPPVTLLILEGVTQGYPLLMVHYGITLIPLVEELRASVPGILTPFYAEDAVFDRSAPRSTQLLKLPMERGADWWYFPDLAKSMFIAELPDQEEEANREIASKGLELTFEGGS